MRASTVGFTAFLVFNSLVVLLHTAAGALVSARGDSATLAAEGATRSDDIVRTYLHDRNFTTEHMVRHRSNGSYQVLQTGDPPCMSVPGWAGYATDELSEGECRPLTVGGIDVTGLVVHQACQHNSERYATLQNCGNHTFSIARMEEPSEGNDTLCEVATVVRVRNDSSNEWQLLGFVGSGTGWESHMSLNAGMLCLDDDDDDDDIHLAVYGGVLAPPSAHFGKPFRSIDVPPSQYARSGIYRTVGTYTGAGEMTWSEPDIVIDASVRSFEERAGVVQQFEDEDKPASAEFDSKLSLVRRTGGGVFLFTRANMDAETGGRHVQVSSSADGIGEWAPFQLITFHDYPTTRSNNIYFFAVTERQGVFLALFPANIANVYTGDDIVEGPGGGVYAAFSRDGRSWTAPERLMTSTVRDDSWRTTDYPMEMVQVDELNRRISLSIDVDIRLDHHEALASGRPPHRCQFDVVGAAYERLLRAWSTAGADWGSASDSASGDTLR